MTRSAVEDHNTRLQQLEDKVETLESLVAELSSALAQSNANLMEICRALDSRIDGVSVNLKQVAA